MQRYQAPRWLPGGHAQTIWPALVARPLLGALPRYRRERWPTPDGDFIDLDWLGEADDTPLLVLFHGLEGSSLSHYCLAFGDWAKRNAWRFVVPHFRGCSGELNLAPRAYHSGDHEEIGWILARLRRAHRGKMFAVGVSLGGNALLRWAQEAGETASASVQAVAAVCAPVDLTASGHAIGRGFNALVYTPMFLRSMKPKALAKLAQHPGLFDREAMLAARNIYEFDNVVTAPLHGFRDADDYWLRASAKPHLQRMRIPALVLNALNDPFVPAASLPRADALGVPVGPRAMPYVTLCQPAHGGHVGFPGGPGPGRALPELVMAWIGGAGSTPGFARTSQHGCDR
ncbi:MAG: alpha/beta fold hydrolase [Burkholderiaceae bacterium]